MTVIRSSANKTYKFIKSLSNKKARDEYRCFVVEGFKSVHEAVDAGAQLRLLAVSESMQQRCMPLIAACDAAICVVADGLFSQLCGTKTPEGVLCVAQMLRGQAPIARHGLYLYCDRVSDPGNAGTLIRCADAVGAAGVIFSHGCVDIYNPKVVRASMGSFFHLPIYDGADIASLQRMQQQGFYLLAGALTDTAQDYRTAHYPENTIIIIGNEAGGVSDAVLSICDRTVIIPIAGRAESLNASVAGALLLYEWRRHHDA